MKKNGRIFFLSCLFIFVSCLGMWFFYNSDSNYLRESSEIQKQYKEVSDKNDEVGEELQEEVDIITEYQNKFNNNDIIAELALENTTLKVPVAKTNDNEYYLDHLLDKRKNKMGSIFMDYRNNTDDRKILIYGHNSKTVNTEFHLLESYLKPSFLKEHSKMFLKTKDTMYQYQIFSIIIVTTDYQHMKLKFTDQEYKDHLEWLKSNSVYDTNIPVFETDEILILQTCYYYPDNSYLLVVGKKI